MKKLACLAVLLVPFLYACNAPEPVSTPSATASTAPIVTQAPTPTLSPVPPTATATPLIIEGLLNIKVNVRSGPGTANSSLGLLDAGQTVRIVSRSMDGGWYQILFPSASQGIGWVASQYVSIPAGTQVPLDATPTPSGPSGVVVQRLNVRSGPGTNFNTLGTLEPKQVVFLTGKNTTASWFQVEYPSGPDGHGWVTAQYIQTDSASLLPVLDDYGKVVTPGADVTDTGPVVSPTPTLGPAYPDGDSSSDPAVRVSFSATGSRRLIYSSQVSAPEGDAEDWIEFTPYSLSGPDANLLFSLGCTGNTALTVELWQAGAPLNGWGSLACGDSQKPISLAAGRSYRMRLSPAAGSGLRLVSYILTVENNP